MSTDRRADIENAEHTHKTLFSFQWEGIPAICTSFNRHEVREILTVKGVDVDVGTQEEKELAVGYLSSLSYA